MKISLRTKERWAVFKHNQSKTNCDWEGAKLYVAPTGGLYCDKMHETISNASETGDDCPRCGLSNVMYWCNACENSEEDDACTLCGKTILVDKIYHNECTSISDRRICRNGCAYHDEDGKCTEIPF